MRQRSRQAAELLIRHDIRQFRKLAELSRKIVNHGIQLVLTGILKRVLILGAADLIVDGEVLHRLHVEFDSGYFVEVWPQTADDREGIDAAIAQRLEVNLNAPAVERCIGAVGPDE